MRLMIAAFLLCGIAGAHAQTRPAAPSPAPRAATAPTAIPRNIDRTLQDELTLDASDAELGEFLDALRKITQTNITVNWNALNAAGITRQTRITLHVKGVTYEAAVRAIMELLPADKGGGANYTVGDNILDITTNAGLGNDPTLRIRNIERIVGYSHNANVTPAERTSNARLLEQILTAELRRAGEPIEGRTPVVTIREGTLAVNVSDRGITLIDRALTNINAPAKLGQVVSGTQLTAQAKRAAEALKAAGLSEKDLSEVARDPEKFKGKISFALLPGTAEELAKPTPAIQGAITDGGILLVGPKEKLATRTLFAAYDLRDIIRKIAATRRTTPTPTAGEIETAITTSLTRMITPDAGTWTPPADLPKNPKASTLTSYAGILLVFTTPQTHRTIAAALQDMAK